MPTPEVSADVTNFTWSAFFGLIVAIINGSALAYWVRSRPKMRELNLNAEEKLRDDLISRVEKLEGEQKEMRLHYESKIDRLQAEYEAAARVARHELANAKMRFRALVMLLKRLPSPPEGLTAILADIEAMEAEQALAEAAEKGAQAGAKIASRKEIGE